MLAQLTTTALIRRASALGGLQNIQMRESPCRSQRLSVLLRSLAPSTEDPAARRAAPRGVLAVLPTAAATDSAVHPMSDYEKFVFDLKGFVVIPSVLTREETSKVRAHVEQYSTNPDSLAPHIRAPMAGPGEFLIDHPRVLGILTTLVSPNPALLRMESVFVSRRSARSNQGAEWRPHAGSSIQPSFNYQSRNGQIFAGMTRVVWELEEVVKGKGGTCLMPGSHKASLGKLQRAGARCPRALPLRASFRNWASDFISLLAN